MDNLKQHIENIEKLRRDAEGMLHISKSYCFNVHVSEEDISDLITAGASVIEINTLRENSYVTKVNYKGNLYRLSTKEPATLKTKKFISDY